MIANRAPESLTGTAPPELAGSLELVLDLGAEIGEGPIWDDGNATLLFVDSAIGRIYRLDPASGGLASLEIGQQIGAAIPRRRGGLVVSGRDGLLSVDADGAVALRVPIERDRGNSRMNDAKCDNHGRLWSGTIPLEHERGSCALYRVDADLTLARVEDGISVSNGIAWSPDETIMYHVDTVSRGIDMYDYDAATGNAKGRRRFVGIDRADGLPDGITVDVEGHVWVALYKGGAVRRYAPDGRWVGQITLPVSAVTSCGFGGSGMTDLYITTATHGLSDERRRDEPTAGALFRYRSEISGMRTNRFAG